MTASGGGYGSCIITGGVGGTVTASANSTVGAVSVSGGNYRNTGTNQRR